MKYGSKKCFAKKLDSQMAGHTNVPSSLHSRQNFSDGEEGPNPENLGANRPNGRVYSPDYMAPPCYQSSNPRPVNQGHHYQQPYTARSNPHLTQRPENNENLTADPREIPDQMDPPYYVQDLVKPRAHSESKQLPEEYSGMGIGANPPPYRQPPHNALPLRDSHFRTEYNSEPPGNLALPPTDYRQQYFPQSMSSGATGTIRRFSLHRLPLGGSQWKICSWRICAIAFLTLSLFLASTTIYLAASQVTEWQDNAHCGPASNNALAPQLTPESKRLPSQEHPSVRDSGNLRPQIEHKHPPTLPVGNLPSILLFPSMLQSFPFAQEHRKWPNPENKVSFSTLSSDSIYSDVRMHDGSIFHDYFVTLLAVAPSLKASISTDQFSNTFVVLNYSPAKVVSSLRSRSSRDSFGNSNVHGAVGINLRPVFNHFLLRRHKRFAISDTSVVVSSPLFDSIDPYPSPKKDPSSFKSSMNENANLRNHRRGKETSQPFSLKATFMKSFASEPGSHLWNENRIVAENLRISKEREKDSLPLKDIIQSANDILNSKTKDKHSTFQPMNGAEIIKQPNLPVTTVLHAVFHQGNTNEKENVQTSLFTTITSKCSSDSTPIFLDGTKSLSDRTPQNHALAINDVPPKLQLSEIHSETKKSTDSKKQTSTVFLNPASTQLPETKQQFLADNTFLTQESNGRCSNGLITCLGLFLTPFHDAKISPTPVLKIRNMTKMEKGGILVNPFFLHISSKTNLLFDVAKVESKLNFTIRNAHIQKGTTKELFSVNFPKEESRNVLEESYKFDVNPKGLQVSSRIKKNVSLKRVRRFKALNPHLEPSFNDDVHIVRHDKHHRDSRRIHTSLNSAEHHINPSSILNEKSDIINAEELNNEQRSKEIQEVHLQRIEKMTQSIHLGESFNKKINSFTIREYNLSQFNPVIEVTERVTTKQINTHQSLRERVHYPQIWRDGGDPSNKSSIMPKEASEILNEYSISARRISERRNIENSVFLKASSIYLSSGRGSLSASHISESPYRQSALQSDDNQSEGKNLHHTHTSSFTLHEAVKSLDDISLITSRHKGTDETHSINTFRRSSIPHDQTESGKDQRIPTTQARAETIVVDTNSHIRNFNGNLNINLSRIDLHINKDSMNSSIYTSPPSLSLNHTRLEWNERSFLTGNNTPTNGEKLSIKRNSNALQSDFIQTKRESIASAKHSSILDMRDAISDRPFAIPHSSELALRLNTRKSEEEIIKKDTITPTDINKGKITSSYRETKLYTGIKREYKKLNDSERSYTSSKGILIEASFKQPTSDENTPTNPSLTTPKRSKITLGPTVSYHTEQFFSISTTAKPEWKDYDSATNKSYAPENSSLLQKSDEKMETNFKQKNNIKNILKDDDNIEASRIVGVERERKENYDEEKREIGDNYMVDEDREVEETGKQGRVTNKNFPRQNRTVETLEKGKDEGNQKWEKEQNKNKTKNGEMEESEMDVIEANEEIRERGEDRRKPQSISRGPFDQHSGNELKSFPRDRNKDPTAVTLGMETTSGRVSKANVNESYVPIFRSEKHYFPETNIDPGQNKHQNEHFSRRLNKNEANASKLGEQRMNNHTSFKNFEPIIPNPYLNGHDPDITTTSKGNLKYHSENKSKNESREKFSISTSEHVNGRGKNNQKFGIESQTNGGKHRCSCSCPCSDFPSESQTFFNHSSTKENKVLEDTLKENKEQFGSKIKERGKSQINSIETLENRIDENSDEDPNYKSLSTGGKQEDRNESDAIIPDIMTHNATRRKHRHHHGDGVLKMKDGDCFHTTDDDPKTRPCKKTTSRPIDAENKLTSEEPATTVASLKMATHKGRKDSSKEKIDSRDDGKCNRDSTKCKVRRKGERDRCFLGKKGCTPDKIADYYLQLFGPRKTKTSQFYVVPILIGREISVTSWHWKSRPNTTHQFSPLDQRRLTDDGAGHSSRRPHQVAPPDGASFAALSLGESLKYIIPPYGYWNLHLTLSDPTEMHLALTIPRGTNLGLYARRNALPTHTQHDLMKVLRGSTSRESRSNGVLEEVELEEMLESGNWFLSLYNDDGDPHLVSLLATPGSGSGECPQRCNERGHCFLGRCQCQTGYSGNDCSEVLCPILCNGRGEYVKGQCQCHPGWKGKECELKIHECEVLDCNGHGRCIDGECKCAKGFTGKFCENVDCPNPTCSGHGWCDRGTCVCYRGWRRPDCSQMDTEARQCLPDCNKHGTFDINTHSCICNPPWTGSDCSKEACALDCGRHGKCENDVCQCDDGWTGSRCDERLCDQRCAEYGQCKNGTCICMTGWNGKHCTLSGCPRSCMNHGNCMADEEGQWFCKCHEEWEGVDCSVRLEMQCDDGQDNDDDGLNDCEDPECCQTPSCTKSQLCMSLPDPIDILLKMQPPAATASFYEKMQFIIQENSLQSFPGSFNKRRAAVIRGRVVTSAGRPIVGLRVTTEKSSDGFTMTRLDGMFDVMVNGGVAVTLHFGKSPFKPRKLQVVVPWNEFVVLDDIIMSVKHKISSHRHAIVDSGFDHYGFSDSLQSSPCPQHDYDDLRPVILSTWQNEFQGECPDVDAILVETQAVQESVQIPGTGLYLVYHSSRATGYKSTLRFQLTPNVIPSSLRRVHLRIVLEGILYKKVFEADPLIKFTYSWDRNNVYKLRVYGTTVARISVGYEHSGCEKTIIWDHHTTKVAGYDLEISEMGGFNLHVHHAYNFHQGILQKGDGRNIHLAGQRHLVTTLLGTGEQREVVCGTRCEGDALKSPLLAPTCLAAAPDGSLYVGDFNLIRRVTPEGKVFTVARLNETRVSYRYHIAVSPVTGKVYVSDPDAHQVLELQSTSNIGDPSRNVIPIVGSGQRCLPGDRYKCGDGGQAIHARLTYPKGLAISPNDDLYIADGTNIRIVQNNIIRTVIGGHEHRSHWAPVPCNGTIERDQLRLRWPTELALSPLDASLHILDDHLVLRLTPDNRVQVLTGRPLHCPAPSHNPQHMSRAALLLAPQSIAFSLQGDLYIAESDTQRINRVRVITTTGHISTFAGADSRCNCRDRACFCHTFDNVSATSAVFSLISAIAVTPDGILHISDQAGYRVRSVRSILPEANAHGEYEIFSPDTHEVYAFNRFGKHVETRNLVTGQTIYRFTYSTNANTGKLSSVIDTASNSFQVIRRTYSKVTFIENPQKQRVTIRFTEMNNDLEKLEALDGYNITFRYHSASGLIQSKMEGGGRTYSYEYDNQGRLVRAVLPTGEIIALNFDLSIRGAQVNATRDGEKSVTAIIRGNTITHETDSVQAISEPRGEGGLRLVTAWDHEISLERTSYRVLETKSPTSAQMFPILSRQQTHIGKELVNRYDWTFSPAEHIYRHDGMKVSADLKVNGEPLLTLGYDPVSSSEAVLSVSGKVLVNITYDKIGRPTKWMPLKPLVPTTVKYDEWGHVILWKREELYEEYEYDRLLRLASVTYGDNTTIRYEFREQLTKPERVMYPSGRSYGLVYDEAGALREVVTPKDSIYSLHLSTSLGFYRLRLALPSNTVVIQMRVDEQGRLVAVSHPNEEGILLYEYDLLGRLRNELYGHGYTQYIYLDSGLLKSVRTRHMNHDIRMDYSYHTGLAKKLKIRYGPKSNLHNIEFRYQYDESARLRVIEGEIKSNSIPELYLKYDNLTGSLLAVSDLRFIRNILKIIIQNQKKYFVSTRILDNYGRISQEIMSLQDRNVFVMHLKYDLRGRISERITEIFEDRTSTNYKYMADGQILEATGGRKRLYRYDKNGDIISFTEENRAEFLHYDECDRVIKAGDGDVEYDGKGYVIRFDDRNFEYNTKGQLISGYSRDKSWSFTLAYDHLSRVSIYRDHYGNVTQIIYGRPDTPDLISHVHNPHTQSTSTLIYDDRDRLIAIDSSQGRYYIATDQNGAPIAFFDDNGHLIGRQSWTPFGRLSDSFGTPPWVGVGPWGGLLEPITGIIILKGYAYNPRLLQWMTPRWDKLTRATRRVTDVFVYRFRNNDPINPPEQLDYHFNDVSDWLRVMGIELNKVLASEYRGYMLERPKPSIDVSALADSEVVSGLWCQYKASINHLQDLSFFSRSHIQRHVGAWKGAPISHQSYVFGPGVLVSNVNGRALVTHVPMIKDGSLVIGNVIRTVLNNSLILDVSSTDNGKDTFYFIKEEKKRAVEDSETLSRLSGIYNVTSLESHDGLENHVSTPTANIIIFYNRRMDKARNRILAQLEVRAEEAAWAREATLVASGRSGTRPWEPSEIQELISKGRVSRYLARHVHSSNKYPLLAADPSNILFKPETSRKRRKSRRKGRKKGGWRRRNKKGLKIDMSELDT